MLSLGIVGLPNAGKSTLFNALTKAGAQVASYPFTTIDPNVGVVEVPDKRLDAIASIVKPEKVTRAAVEFVDIAGLVPGASKGEGLGNQFLAHIREVDAVVHVVRCFEDKGVPHVTGSLDPVRDYGLIQTELILADLESVERRIAKTEPMLKTGKKEYRDEMDYLEGLKSHLSAGLPAKTYAAGPFDVMKSLFLLTGKPMVVVANVSEEDCLGGDGLESHPYVKALKEHVQGHDTRVVPVSARLEASMAEMAPGEAKAFAEELGIGGSRLGDVVFAGYQVLGLITFFTIKGPETRAWPIPHGTKAPQAAGKIHSDMERGFIKAEVVSCDDLIAHGSLAEAREHGKIRLEGKDYVVQDGDIVLFKFNV